MRLTTGVLVPLMQLNARIVVVTFLCVGIFIIDPKVSVLGVIIFSLTYFIMYKVVRIRLEINGKSISDLNENRFRLMNEGFGGIKDILLLGRAQNFIHSFNKSGKKLALSQGTNLALAQVPRYFIELAAFGAMVGMVMYLLINYEVILVKSYLSFLFMQLPQLSCYPLFKIFILALHTLEETSPLESMKEI